jgi:hypothetical protein
MKTNGRPIKLSMKDDASQRARKALKQKVITATAFNAALDAILSFEVGGTSWTRLVESAYERLPKRERPAVRFLMMSFRSSCLNHDGVLRLMPKRFTGEFDLVELSYVMEAAFALGKTELTRQLAKRLTHATHAADHPLMRSLLRLDLAEYLSREGEWDEALAVLEAVQSDETLTEDAVTCMVEVHAVRALLALRRGLHLVKEDNQNIDPETELALPDEAKAIRGQAAREFRRLQRILERIVPKKRQKELGINA